MLPPLTPLALAYMEGQRAKAELDLEMANAYLGDITKQIERGYQQDGIDPDLSRVLVGELRRIAAETCPPLSPSF